MKCFGHLQVDAIGLCKSCSKAVCADCVIDTGRGLCCSDICVTELSEQNQIIDKSKRIYSIGTKAPLIPTGLLMYFFFGFTFGGFGIFQTIKNGSPEWFLLVMGTGFLVVGVLAWIKNRKLNLNC